MVSSTQSNECFYSQDNIRFFSDNSEQWLFDKEFWSLWVSRRSTRFLFLESFVIMILPSEVFQVLCELIKALSFVPIFHLEIVLFQKLRSVYLYQNHRYFLHDVWEHSFNSVSQSNEPISISAISCHSLHNSSISL